MIVRSTFQPRVLGGRAGLRGTGFGIPLVEGRAALGLGCEEIMADHADLRREEVQQASEDTAWPAQGQVVEP